MAQIETSRHHSFWPRRHYKTRIERDFRQHPFLINRIPDEAHRELHICVSPPLKLSREQMIGALCFLEDMKGEQLEPVERVLYLADYLEDRSQRESRVAANLRLQAVFIGETTL